MHSMMLFSCLSSYSGMWHITGLSCAILAATITFVSCTETEKNDRLEQALQSYRKYSEEINENDMLNVQDFPMVIRNWHTLEDSVFDIMEDSTAEKQMETLREVATYSHILLSKLNSVIDTRLHGYTDILSLQTAMAEYELEQEALDYCSMAQTFFSSLDTVCIDAINPSTCEEHYCHFLSLFLEREFSSWSDVLEYMAQEDYMYRQYLNNYLDHPLSASQQIVSDTENIVSLMIDGTHNGNYTESELLMFMASRTNRRIIQQADTCLSSIENGHIYNPQYGIKAMLSALTPFTSFNSLLIVIRTEEQRKKINEIGERIPKAMRQLEKQNINFPEPLDSLPNQLLKEYVNYIISK